MANTPQKDKLLEKIRLLNEDGSTYLLGYVLALQCTYPALFGDPPQVHTQPGGIIRLPIRRERHRKKAIE